MTELKRVMSQSAALRVAGVPRSSWHYRQRPRPRVAEPVPHTQRRSHVWTTDAEQQQILGWLDDPAYGRTAVGEVFIKALDRGVYIASMSTWHRIARRYRSSRSTRRRRAKHRSSAIPELLATGPNQVWSWDITRLPTAVRGQSFEFYVALDIYSRRVVAYRVELVESDELAKEMFIDAFGEQQAKPRVVHSDGGASMTSTTVADFFETLDVRRSRNRPRVSNDNPYSESAFKTAKYRPAYPVIFDDVEHARRWADAHVSWYNYEHQHSGIAWHTPHDVHTGTHAEVTARRQAVLDQHYKIHPERHHTRPRAPELEPQVWINEPTKEETGSK